MVSHEYGRAVGVGVVRVRHHFLKPGIQVGKSVSPDGRRYTFPFSTKRHGDHREVSCDPLPSCRTALVR
jgi:hypothetical protein